MTRWLLDLFVILVLDKEVFALRTPGSVPITLGVLVVCCLPFFLGMGSDPIPVTKIASARSGGLVRPVIRFGAAAASLIVFLHTQALQGIFPFYLLCVVVSVACYATGRWVGMVWKFVWFVVGLLLAGLLFLLLTAHR